MILPTWAHAAFLATVLSSSSDETTPQTLVTGDLPSISVTLSTSSFIEVVTGIPIPVNADSGSLPTTTLQQPVSTIETSAISNFFMSDEEVEKRTISGLEGEGQVTSMLALPTASSSNVAPQSILASVSQWDPSTATAPPQFTGESIQMPKAPFSELPLSMVPALDALLDPSTNNSDTNATVADGAIDNVPSAAVGHGMAQHEGYTMSILVTCNGTDHDNMTCSGHPVPQMHEGGLENITSSTAAHSSSIPIPSTVNDSINSTSLRDQNTTKSGGIPSITSRNPMSMAVLGTLMAVTEFFFVFFA